MGTRSDMAVSLSGVQVRLKSRNFSYDLCTAQKKWVSAVETSATTIFELSDADVKGDSSRFGMKEE
jgi:hypothetical protein